MELRGTVDRGRDGRIREERGERLERRQGDAKEKESLGGWWCSRTRKAAGALGFYGGP